MPLKCFGQLCVLASVLLLTVAMNCVHGQKPGGNRTVVSTDTYERVLDLLFPRAVLEGEGTQYIFVIRYEPTWKAESQITITQRAGGVEIVEYTSVGSIYLKLEDILRRGGQENARKMARLINVRRRVVNLSPAVFRQLRDSFFDQWILSLRREKVVFDENSREAIATFDGTGYSLWYKGAELVQYKLAGTSVSSPTLPNENPLIEWMKAVRLEVDKASVGFSTKD